MIWAPGAMQPKSGYRLQAAQVGHREVEDDHVRLKPCRLDNCFVAVGGFADDREAEGLVHDHADERAHRVVVVANEHAGGGRSVRGRPTAHLGY